MPTLNPRGGSRVLEAARRARTFLFLVLVAVLLPPASAYDIGGHHFTVALVLAQAGNGDSADPYEITEAFCAELPDLVPELDAVTQRINVFKSRVDMQWGLLGNCGSNVSRHMVATQWYVHALTKQNSEQFREMAKRIVVELRAARLKEPNPQRRLNLACETGLAIHLLGDSYAHSQLSDPEKLYPTGNGHWKDVHKPDMMLSRDLISGLSDKTRRWADWVTTMSEALAPNHSVQSILELRAAVMSDPGDDYGESELTQKLLGRFPNSWLHVYEPDLDKWAHRSWDGRIDGPKCQDILDTGPALAGNNGNGTRRGVPAVGNLRPQCAALWREYLMGGGTWVGVRKRFDENKFDPVRNGKLKGCDAASDTLDGGAE